LKGQDSSIDGSHGVLVIATKAGDSEPVARRAEQEAIPMTRLLAALALMSFIAAAAIPEAGAKMPGAAVKPINPAKKARKHKVAVKAPTQLPAPAPPNPTLEWHSGPKMDM
jgi:hypothetical protein